MKIFRTEGKPFLGVVCCQHGHEVFGLEVFRKLKGRKGQKRGERGPAGIRRPSGEKEGPYPGLVAIVANEEAVAAGKRSIETDLNRSYPGRPDGTHEERLAARLVQELAGARFVLDIHTTTCDTELVPFCGEFDRDVKRIIGLTTAKNIVAVGEKLAKQSLLGAVSGAVSLEYGEKYAAAHGLADVIRLIDALYAGTPGRGTERRVFRLRAAIPRGAAVPASARDFVYCPELSGYPVLLGEKSYADKLGFVADEPSVVVM